MNRELAELRARKAEVGDHLRRHMERAEETEINGIKLRALQPRTRRPRVPAAIRRENALSLFRAIGIQRPDEFWNEFQATQKPATEPQNDSR